MQTSVVGIFIILVFSVLYLARDFVLPILIALILALTLRPIVRFFERRGIPAGVTAVFLTISLACGAAIATYAVYVPAVDWINRAPQIGEELKDKLSDLRAPAEAIAEAEAEIGEITTSAPGGPQAVVVQGPGLFSTAATGLLSGAAALAVSLLLLGFFLSSGNLFYSKLVESWDRLTDKKRALRIVTDVEGEISRYLFAIALINACLGAVVGVGFFLLDMPSPHVWGVVVALANFMPYIGAILGIGAAAIVAVLEFDTLDRALLVPAFYAVCTIVEGQVVTPFLIGRRLQINIVAVFISVAFWAWLWGIVGALIAVPLLVIIKTLCDHVESLRPFGNFLKSANSRFARKADERKARLESAGSKS